MLRKLVTVVTSGKGMWETDTLFIINPFILSELLKWPTCVIYLKLTLLLNFTRWALSIKWRKKKKTPHAQRVHIIKFHYTNSESWRLICGVRVCKRVSLTVKWSSGWKGSLTAEKLPGQVLDTGCAPSGNRASSKLAAPPTGWVHACSVMSDSSQPHVAHQAPLSMELSSKNTGVGFHCLLQGIFPTQGLNPSLLRVLHWPVVSLPLCHLGGPTCYIPIKIVNKTQQYWGGL